MAQLSFDNATTTDLKSAYYQTPSASIDEAGEYTIWYNSNFNKYLGYYKNHPGIRQTIDAFAIYTAGRGWECESSRSQIILENITGWGEDTFDSIIQNMLVVKKINGDAYCEIVWDKESKQHKILNLKPLNPQTVAHKVNKKGIIEKYIILNAKTGQQEKELDPIDVLHISERRIANEVHGQSVISPIMWALDAKEEAMRDERRALHIGSIVVIEVDAQDSDTFNKVSTQWKNAIKNGEVAVFPKGVVSASDVVKSLNVDKLSWINYLDGYIYKGLGMPEIITGGSSQLTESNAKMGSYIFEQPIIAEQRQLEQDLWNQLFIRVKFIKNPSLRDPIASSEAANTRQTGFQPNDTQLKLTGE